METVETIQSKINILKKQIEEIFLISKVEKIYQSKQNHTYITLNLSLDNLSIDILEKNIGQLKQIMIEFNKLKTQQNILFNAEQKQILETNAVGLGTDKLPGINSSIPF
jgi:hypothetical protein